MPTSPRNPSPSLASQKKWHPPQSSKRASGMDRSPSKSASPRVNAESMIKPIHTSYAFSFPSSLPDLSATAITPFSPGPHRAPTLLPLEIKSSPRFYITDADKPSPTDSVSTALIPPLPSSATTHLLQPILDRPRPPLTLWMVLF